MWSIFISFNDFVLWRAFRQHYDSDLSFLNQLLQFVKHRIQLISTAQLFSRITSAFGNAMSVTATFQSVFKNVSLIGILGSGVQLGPLGSTATNRPIVPALDDYDDGTIGGMMISRGNLSTRRKTGPMPLCPPQTSRALPGRERGPSRWEASD
jgi:hypothetical protein